MVITYIFTNKEDVKSVTTRNMKGAHLNYNKQEEDHHKQKQCEQQTEQGLSQKGKQRGSLQNKRHETQIPT